ncbi:MAG TPA: porin [Thiobacillaceae bacterium]|nr:porin [Thiobacillaceae bacterium]HNU64383.1 porin [Thiobacillaceae bacterium]
MKKSLIALAVAGVFAAPAFAATSNVDVYGIINVAIEDYDNTPTGGGGANVSYTPSVVSNFSRIGFKGSEDLGGGLKAIWQVESALDGGANAGGAGAIGGTTWGMRNTYVGLAGGFGTVLGGRHDSAYKSSTGPLDLFADTVGDYNLGRANGVELLMNAMDNRAPQTVAYISPNMSGFTFAGNIMMTNDAAPRDTMDGYSLSGVYNNGPLFGALAYQNIKDTAGAGNDTKAYKLGLGYSFGDAKVGFLHENVKVDGAAKKRKSYALNGAYAMGPITLKALYGMVDNANFGNNTDQDMWALGADYSLSKRTTAYFVYASGDSDSSWGAGMVNASNRSSNAGWNLGVKHSF